MIVFYQLFNVIKSNSELIAVLTSVSTFITALISAITLREIKLHRQSSYLPELLINDLDLKIDSFTGLVLNYRDSKTSLKGEKSIPNLILKNIGSGVANNIKYQFLYNNRKCLNILKKYSKDLLELSYIESENIMIFKEINTENIFFIPYIDTYLKKFINKSIRKTFKNIMYYIPDYFVPIKGKGNVTKLSNSSNDMREIIIPFNYYFFLLFSEYASFKKENLKYHNSIISYPKLKLKISYHDIMKKKYTKYFNIHINFLFYPSKYNDNLTGYINISIIEKH